MTLYERVRTSFAAEFDVLEEIGRGGMGVVFRAVDRALERPVAIKVLLPEHATARAVERFLQEARALAAVEHPRVLQVHHAGEADGLYYYIMELAAGATLAERLERGPLVPAELEQLAVDLLDALAAIHDAGIVHRDVKPSNIFLVDGHAFLGDFGIAVASPSRRQRLTRSGELVGTPQYLAPEQRHGDATTATDVHGAALVLYEAATGSPWHDMAASKSPWAAVPKWLRRPLRRALQSDPEDRWADATAFRSAIDRRPRAWARAAAVAVVGIAVALVLVVALGRTPPASGEVGDLAVLPFEVAGTLPDGRTADGPCDPERHLGCQLAHLVAANLEDLPQLKVIPAARIVHFDPSGVAPFGPSVRRELRSTYFAGGLVVQRGDRLELRLVVEDSLGQRLPERVVTAADPWDMADSVALELVRLVQPRLVSSFRGLEESLTSSVDAMREYLLGEHAFHRNAWIAAEEHYRSALAMDSTFALANWRLWNVVRWRLPGQDAVELGWLYREYGDRLGTVDRALLGAVAEGAGRRIPELEAVAEKHGYVAYARMLFGDELFHRGPLVGRPLEEAARQITAAAELNPYLAPAYEHGAMVFIRLGRQEAARRYLDRLSETAAKRAPGEALHIPTLLEQAYLERFQPARAAEYRDVVFDLSEPDRGAAVQSTARMGLELDVPAAQRDLGRRLVRAPGSPASARVNGHTAQALALMVLGRPAAALAHFDSATVVSGTQEAALEAAEWRVVLSATAGVPVREEERERGRAYLEGIAGTAADSAGRAALALAIDAFARDSLAAGRRWRRAIRGTGTDAERDRLDRLAGAAEALARGQHGAALGLSAPLLNDQYQPPSGRDPFTRTVLHTLRARAYEAAGAHPEARRELVWSENQDITFALGGPVQAVEVDWVASPYTDRRRAELALAQQDTSRACRLLGRILYLWQDVEPELVEDRDESRRLHDEACR